MSATWPRLGASPGPLKNEPEPQRLNCLPHSTDAAACALLNFVLITPNSSSRTSPIICSLSCLNQLKYRTALASRPCLSLPKSHSQAKRPWYSQKNNHQDHRQAQKHRHCISLEISAL